MSAFPATANAAGRPSPGAASAPPRGGVPRVVVAHAGKQHAYRHALAVHRAGALERFVTSSWYEPSRWPDRLAAGWSRLDGALRRRRLDGIPADRVARRWRLEVPEVAARSLPFGGRLAELLMFRRDAAFDRWVARSFAAAGDLYWGFQGSCLESLRAARRAGRIAVAEFATAHVTRAVAVLEEEARRHPEWADTISNLRFPVGYRERLEREPLEADWCVAASTYTRETLLEAGVAGDRILRLPLGADLSRFRPADRPASGRFRILFVGGITQRKGVKYLLDAFERMRTPSVELVLLGPIHGSGREARRPRPGVTLLGRRDAEEVAGAMQSCHLLVLPSVFEGFGLVIPEAMATGMPVIASTHTAGPDILREGVDGFVLEPDDVEGLAERMARLAGDPSLARSMGREAQARAGDFSWDRHGERVAELLASLRGRGESRAD